MEGTPRFAPDGLSEVDIERLFNEARTVWTRSPAPTSALLDGTAARRADRRRERRAIATVVRALPTVAVAASGAEVAA